MNQITFDGNMQHDVDKSCQGLKHLSKFINWISYEKVMNTQNYGTHNLRILRLLLRIIKKKNHFNVILMVRFRINYKEEGGGLLQILSHVNVMSSKQVYNPKLVPFWLTTYIFWLV
jgi:hypothetical protein